MERKKKTEEVGGRASSRGGLGGGGGQGQGVDIGKREGNDSNRKDSTYRSDISSPPLLSLPQSICLHV